jgi:hypothetical protein
MENYVGIYWVLETLPIWATLAITIVVVQLMILVGRHALEGIPYQVAYSALVGEGLCFTVMIVIEAGILQRGEVYVPLWFQSGTVHIWLVANCLVFGVVVCWLTLRSRWGHMMDIYHDVVVIPLILYSAITLLPVVFYSGTRVEQWTVVVFILLWLVSFAFDVKYDRLNQRRLLVRSIDAIEDMKEEDLRR